MSDTSKNFQILRHANGTHTLVDTENGQAMHSRIGPALEAGLVYADRAKIEEGLCAESSRHVLYDVGMGTGANVVAVFDRIASRKSVGGTLEVYSFEAKPDGLRMALRRIDLFPELAPWELRLRELLDTGKSEFQVGQVQIVWRLLVGDFYSRMSEAPPPDSVFFDFYSPKVVPDLWSLDRFISLRKKIGECNSRLFTYSAATPVRLHLFAAGFFVGAGATTGVKTETTIAATRYELLAAPLPHTWLRKLRTSASIAASEYAAAKTLAANHPQWILVPANS
jgi:tRNA U34 5-methylaminomethyl-2-thiouridine-forming methyltransferase MnmC